MVASGFRSWRAGGGVTDLLVDGCAAVAEHRPKASDAGLDPRQVVLARHRGWGIVVEILRGFLELLELEEDLLGRYRLVGAVVVDR